MKSEKKKKQRKNPKKSRDLDIREQTYRVISVTDRKHVLNLMDAQIWIISSWIRRMKKTSPSENKKITNTIFYTNPFVKLHHHFNAIGCNLATNNSFFQKTTDYFEHFQLLARYQVPGFCSSMGEIASSNIGGLQGSCHPLVMFRSTHQRGTFNPNPQHGSNNIPY